MSKIIENNYFVTLATDVSMIYSRTPYKKPSGK